MILRIFILMATAIAMIIFWHNPMIMPLKIFVVYLHELSHALGALFTGGDVQLLVINWDESGFTRTRGGNFLAITASGYLGSILFGSVMLSAAIISRYEKICAVAIGMVIVVFPLLIPQKLSSAVFVIGVSWGVLFIITGLLSSMVARVLLFLMGGLTSLYSVYDLGDFFRGDIAQTDAGVIAAHYMKNEYSALILSYLIGVLISVLSIWVLYKIVYHALHVSEQLAVFEAEAAAEAERLNSNANANEIQAQNEFLSSLSPETIEMIVRMHEQRKGE